MSDHSTPVGAVVTVGTYDGVHLGHQRLIAETHAEAERRGLKGIVVTFDRHPADIVSPARAPRLLTDLDQKLELLDATEIDQVVVLRFDELRAQESAEEFVEEFLVATLQAKAVIVGSNFRFGHGQRGDTALLSRLGIALGFDVRGIELVIDDATKTVVSSRAIRALVAAGELAEAERCLGRPLEVRGEVVAVGESVTIAVPPSILLPPEGVYPILFGPAHTAGIRTTVAIGPGAPTTVEVAAVGPDNFVRDAVRCSLTFARSLTR